MGNVNLIVSQKTAENITALIEMPLARVTEISKVPNFSLAYLAEEIVENNYSSDFYQTMKSAIDYNFQPISIDSSLLCKRSFRIDDDAMNTIRDFIVSNDPSIKRPKSSYIIRLAIAYTLMSYEIEAISETPIVAPPISQLELLEKIIDLFKKASTEDKLAIQKIAKIKDIVSE